MRLRLRTDDQLVALFRLGNEEAFRVIHDRYRARLLAYTRQMLAGSAAEAEDALQDVFLRAYGALRADDRPVTLRAWLYRVAHNRCIDQLRRPGTVELFDNLRLVNGTGADPIAEVQRRDDLRRLVADVGELPGQQRSALLMREMEGLTYNELAGALSVSVPAVKSLLVRARTGLTAAQDARDTACGDIRSDLEDAHGHGVRVNGRSRRHLRECSACRDYRRALKVMQPSNNRLAAMLGIGGSGAAAGGGAAASSGAIFGGGVAAATATKVAAAVCCAAVLGGGAVEASHQLQQAATPARPAAPHVALAASDATAPVAAIRTVGAVTRQAVAAHGTAVTHRPRPSQQKPVAPPAGVVGLEPQLAAMAPALATDAPPVPRTGGVLGPDDDSATTVSATDPASTPATPGTAAPASPTGSATSSNANPPASANTTPPASQDPATPVSAGASPTTP